MKNTTDTSIKNLAMSGSNQLAHTRNLFIGYLSYTKPLSYSEWLSLDDSDKAAALYVQFYEQITLAWFTAKKNYGDEDEAVETIMQYLEKNVPIIKNSPSRFTSNYMYRVAYNCLSCICYSRKFIEDRLKYEVSNIQFGPDGNEYDIFEHHSNNSDTTVNDYLKEELWDTIEELAQEDARVLDVVELLINGSKRTATGFCLPEQYKVSSELIRQKEKLQSLRYKYKSRQDSEAVRAVEAEISAIPKYSARSEFNSEIPVIRYEHNGQLYEEPNQLNKSRSVNNSKYDEIINKLRIKLEIYYDDI